AGDQLRQGPRGHPGRIHGQRPHRPRPPDRGRHQPRLPAGQQLPADGRQLLPHRPDRDPRGDLPLGPSFKKADYSNYGIEQTDFSAPGGFFRDYFGSDQYMQLENTNLSTMPTAPAEAALAQNPATPTIVKSCRGDVCGYYQYLQGTSMASPHATGVAALIVGAHGKRDPAHGGLTMSPGAVERVLTRTARQTPCPFPPIATYPDR